MSAIRPFANARINQAILFAVMAHGNQVRKGNEHIPYVFHCIDAANEVIYYSGLPKEELENASIAAILHDTIEDTVASYDDLLGQFGLEIACAVRFLTKEEISGKAESVSKMEELQENIARLKTASRWVRAVKLADRVSNLKSFPAMWSREKISNYLAEAAFIARELGDASEGLHARLLSRIAQARITLSIIG
jgi:(p)ppGpp synthase/HD superfamily hydrolase